MPAMSDYLKTELLDHVLRGEAYTPPVVVYLGLYVETPYSGNPGTEVVGGTYIRQLVSFAMADPYTGTTSDVAVSFTDLPDADIVGAALLDDVTGGNMLFHGDLNVSRTVLAGEGLDFAIGDLDVALA